MPSNLGKSIWRRSFGQAAIISPIETPERSEEEEEGVG
jgi:hypothetical protein